MVWTVEASVFIFNQVTSHRVTVVHSVLLTLSERGTELQSADWIASAGHRAKYRVRVDGFPSHELHSILQAETLEMTLDRRAS